MESVYKDDFIVDDWCSDEQTNKSPGEVTLGSLEVWNELPEVIKQDPSLATFREGYERHVGTTGTNQLPTGPQNGTGGTFSSFIAPTKTPREAQDIDPLPSCSRSWGPPTIRVLSSSPSPPSQHKSTCSGAKQSPFLLTVNTDRKEEEEDDIDPVQVEPWARYTKMSLLVAVWLLFTYILITKGERRGDTMHQISVPKNETKSYLVLEHPSMRQITIVLQGALLPPYYSNLSSRYLHVWIELLQTRHEPKLSPLSKNEVTYHKRISEVWKVPLVLDELVEFVPEIKIQKRFSIDDFGFGLIPVSVLRFQFRTNLNTSLPLSLNYDLFPIDPDDGIIYAAAVLLGLYVLIVFEVIHRTLAAMLASTMSVAILAAFDERPSSNELISWIDIETLLLLFSMMVLVGILSETGIFDYLAVLAYKITNGQVWPLINTLCFFTAAISSILDNVTTVLLMTPVTIKLCEVMELNPVPILMAMIIYSNIGGAMTPVGDPPNVIIATNPDIINAGVDFGVFTIHMSIGLILVMIFVHYQLRFFFRNINDLRFNEPQEVQELRHEITVWQRAAASLSSYSKDEDMVRYTLLKKVRLLFCELKQMLLTGSVGMDKYTANLEELQEKYPIRDMSLLIKSGMTLLFVVSMFFLHSVPNLNLSLGWSALLGAILLLLLADNEDMEGVLARVEWGTLIFFTALFVLMEALSRLGLIDWIGRQTEWVILSVDHDHRLAVAILLILWVSAVASSFVDNIPLTTMMIRIVTSLSQKTELNLPLQPLVWALALGACLGGNGTLIGSSANVVCAGVAEQHGYRFTFMEYLKIGFPVMIGSIIIVTIYLMVAHVLFGWNS